MNARISDRKGKRMAKGKKAGNESGDVGGGFSVGDEVLLAHEGLVGKVVGGDKPTPEGFVRVMASDENGNEQVFIARHEQVRVVEQKEAGKKAREDAEQKAREDAAEADKGERPSNPGDVAVTA